MPLIMEWASSGLIEFVTRMIGDGKGLVNLDSARMHDLEFETLCGFVEDACTH
jgi:hypothetical protein